MGLNRRNTKHFDRNLFIGVSETITLLKRDDDLRQGVVRAIILYGCWRSAISKTGQTIQRDMTGGHSCDWNVPRRELERVGVAYLSALDRIVQTEGLEAGYVWQPESTTRIDVQLLGNYVKLGCLRTDPPLGA